MHHLARPAAALTLALGTVMALAACSSPGTTASTGQQASSAEVSAGSGGESGPAGEQTQAPADSGDQVPGTAQSGQDGLCATSDLKIAIKQGDAAAGSRYYTIAFTNTSPSTCRLNGHPGVSAVTGRTGKQIGKSAALGDPQPASITLKTGKTAHAVLKAVNIGDDGGPLAGRCDVTSAAGFRVFPPDTRQSVFVAHKNLKACASGVNWLTVGAVAK